MKITKKEGSTHIELENNEEVNEFSEFLNKKIQEKSSDEDFYKIIESDLEG